jgi:outer membrane protein assembly factor BamB
MYEMDMKMALAYKPVAILLLFLTNFMFSCDNRAQSGTRDESENVPEKEEIIASGADVMLSRTISGTDSARCEWPGFHGPDRQNKSRETGLLTAWPEGGPDLLWTVSGLGEGYASVSIAEGLIYTAGSVDDQSYVFAYDLDGNLIWKKPNGPAWKVEVSWATGYDGSRSTPTYDNGIVYHLSEASRLTAYDAKTGEEIWSRDLMSDFAASMPDYGFTESVLIDGDRLFVRPAGRRGFQVCLDKKTGETLWTNIEIPGTYAYNSAVLHDFGGYRQVIGASSSCYYGVDSETGALLWTVDFENPYEVNCTDAVVSNEYVLMSNGEGGSSLLVRLHASGDKITPERVWQNEIMDNYHGGIIFHEGYFYGSGDHNRGWFAIELLTGEQMWKSSPTMGSITYADGMLYLYNENGRMKLVRATPDLYEETGEFQLPNRGKGPFWAHPVVCGGRLYLRHADQLYAYTVKNAE